MNYRKKAMLMAGALLCLNLSIYSQSISLKMNNVPVKKAIAELQTKSGYSFVYMKFRGKILLLRKLINTKQPQGKRRQ